MKKRVILAAGGTGGHLFPAQSLAVAFPDWEILFVAGGLKCNRYFDQKKFAFEEIDCATFTFREPIKLFKGCLKIFKGASHARKILQRFEADLVVGFGSFFSLPTLIAALFENVPIVLHEQNTIPGKVNRFFSSFACATAITFPTTRKYLNKKALKKTVEVTFPLRSKSAHTPDMCSQYFGLIPQKKTLLVFGGSAGAASVNSLFLETAPYLSDIQVIHFTGNEKTAAVAKKRYVELNISACVKAFEPYMDRAMQIADLAITRAGAATIAELIEYELPAILIPFPFATDHHQEENGLHFVFQARGGRMYREDELTPHTLSQIITQEIVCLNERKENIMDYKKRRECLPFVELIERMLTKC